MQQKLVLGLVVLVCGLALPGSMVRAEVTSPTVYLALGDSFAAGVGASTPELSYARRLFSFLQAQGAADQLVNLAVPGETSASFCGAASLCSGAPGGQLAAAIATIADPATDLRLVTLDIGGNDLLRLIYPPNGPCVDPNNPACAPAVAAALSSFAQNYTYILGMLQQALALDPGEEHLLVMTYPNSFSGTNTPYEVLGDQAFLGSDAAIDCAANQADSSRIGLNDLIACIGGAPPFSATIVDLYPPFKNKGPLLTHVGDTPPDIHPNDLGYAVIADALKAALCAVDEYVSCELPGTLTPRIFIPMIMR